VTKIKIVFEMVSFWIT